MYPQGFETLGYYRRLLNIIYYVTTYIKRTLYTRLYSLAHARGTQVVSCYHVAFKYFSEKSNSLEQYYTVYVQYNKSTVFKRQRI